MSGLTRIKHHEIKIGEAIPWSVYDDEGRLLLNEGNVIPSAKILSAILEHGAYRVANLNDIEPVGSKTADKNNPFLLLDECAGYLQVIFDGIDAHDPQVENRIKQLVKGIIQLCAKHADACVGAVHLAKQDNYLIQHPLAVAILCELVAKRLRFPDIERYAVLAAALTANVGMRDLQMTLLTQSTPLSEKQRKYLQAHPAKSAEMLMETGLTNVDWLKAVFQHHERIDGSGYPEGIRGAEIGRPAKVVAIADRYAAMVNARAHRKAIHGKDTLRELLIENGKFYDQELSLVLISELGVYPPGSIVQLKNAEVGMVINRGKKNTSVPYVSVFMTSAGNIMDKPVLRNCAVSKYFIKDKFELNTELPFELIDLWRAAFASNEQINAA